MSYEMVKVEDIKSDKKYALVGGPFGSDLSGKHYVETGVPVIRGGNLPFDKKFDSESFVYVSQRKADKLKSNTAHPGDLVFTQRGTLGQVGIIPTGEFDRYIISQSQMKLTVDKNKAEPLYVYYYFRTKECVKRIENHALSSGVPHINLGILQQFKIPLPSLPTQKKIAAILSTYDDLIDNNNQRIQLLEDMAEEIYKEWFVRLRFPGWQQTRFFDAQGREVAAGTRGALPEEWKQKTFTDEADVLSGGTPSTNVPKYWDGDIPFFTPRDTTEGFFTFTTEKMISKAGLAKCNSQLFEPNTIFITARGTVGKINLNAVEMAMNQTNYAIRSSGIAGQYYLFFWLKDQIKQLKKQATGATFSAITVKDFSNLEIVLPTANILNRYHVQVESLFELMKTLQQKKQLLQQTCDLLLPRLISGKLPVADAEIKTLPNLSIAAEPETPYHKT